MAEEKEEKKKPAKKAKPEGEAAAKPKSEKPAPEAAAKAKGAKPAPKAAAKPVDPAEKAARKAAKKAAKKARAAVAKAALANRVRPAPAAQAAPPPEPRKTPEKTLTVTQIGSPIGRQAYQRASLQGLGLNKLRRRRVLEDTPAVRGMIKRVKHLVRVETG